MNLSQNNLPTTTLLLRSDPVMLCYVMLPGLKKCKVAKNHFPVAERGSGC